MMIPRRINKRNKGALPLVQRLGRALTSQSEVLDSATYSKGFRKGKTYAEVEAIYLESKGICAICGAPKAIAKNHALDHDHKTGELRGVLCSLCNTGLGMFQDNIRYLRNAIQYLRHYQDKATTKEQTG